MQLLAGHFHVAFITLFGAALYAPMRCWWLRMPLREGVRHCGRLAACCLLSGAMAAVQLWPTWELKARSQRAAGRAGHDPNYGRIPAWYLAQAIAPWLFYPEYRSGGSLEARLAAANTNRVEAHLYFGILPLLLAAAGFMAGRRRPDAGPLSRGDKGRPGRCRPDTSALLPWLIVGLSALVMATGCWTERFGWLPGPGYFTGPGRYGLLAQLAVSVAAACGLDAVLCRVPGRASQAALAGVVVAATWADLSWATERVSYAQAVWPPPISLRDRSPLAARLKLTDRVLSRNQNAMTLLGTAMLPVYLGIGPAQYFEGPAALPGSLRWDGPMSPAVADWLRQAGVTHVLAFEPHPDWPLELLWRGVDPMLHYMLGRSPQQPLWLYRLSGSLGRAYAVAAGSSAKSAGGRVIDGAVRSIQLAANEVVIRVQLPVSAIVVLTDLAYPGWRVEVDGQARPGRLWRGTYRAVAVRPGSHTVRWYYRPASALRGGAISLLGWLSWVAVLAVPWCRRRKDA